MTGFTESADLAELGWEPAFDFDDGLRATVEWYAEHRGWWEPLKGRAPVSETSWR